MACGCSKEPLHEKILYPNYDASRTPRVHQGQRDEVRLARIYHFILTLSWPQFAGLVLGIYVFINLCFAMLYLLGGRCIAGLVPGSFSDAFFFSVETLATVGYGHAYPDTLYGHCVATLEIMVGLFGLAVMTGLIFVRFSRPTARIKHSIGRYTVDYSKFHDTIDPSPK